MKTVWKYVLETTAHQVIELPASHQILFVGRDPAEGKIAIWALVDPQEQLLVPVRLRIEGTGHPIHGSPVYLGTVILGVFVWHVFQE